MAVTTMLELMSLCAAVAAVLLALSFVRRKGWRRFRAYRAYFHRRGMRQIMQGCLQTMKGLNAAMAETVRSLEIMGKLLAVLDMLATAHEAEDQTV